MSYELKIWHHLLHDLFYTTGVQNKCSKGVQYDTKEETKYTFISGPIINYCILRLARRRKAQIDQNVPVRC